MILYREVCLDKTVPQLTTGLFLTVGQAQMLLVILIKALLYSSASLSLDSVTLSQHEQHCEPESDK